MSDLDFDELDKAVNSLVGGAPSDKEKTETTEAPKADEPSVKPENTPVTNLPTRRSGRFMDMKHNSSAVKNDGSLSLMTSTKTNIQPLSSDIQPEPKSEKPVESKIEDESDDKVEVSTNGNMPDPIEHFDAQQKKNDDEEADDKPDVHTDKTDDDKEESKLDFEETDTAKDEKTDDDKEDEDKKTSPFLDDAKVEKRPLGGVETKPELDAEQKTVDVKDSDTKDGADEKTPETPPEPVELPPELDKDLVAIEADEAPETTTSPDIPSPEADTNNEEDKKQEEPASEVEPNETGTRDHKEEVSQLLATAASGSIPDQYKRENRSHELHSSHPLFDSEHFKNSPAAAPKKPKSAAAKIFQWLFISLGLLLLGGSLGAAVFVFISKQ